jgi:hypothetical protein
MHGYFERFGEETAEKMKQCLLDQGKAVVENQLSEYQSLEFMSRLSLFFEEPDQQWFELKEAQPELYKRITMYWRRHRLFHADERIKTALFDWKPLPRASIKDWPYQIEDNLFNHKEYDRAYEFKKHSNPFLKEMVQKRLDLLENILSSEKFSTLVSFGDRPGKVKLLINALSRVTNQPVHFEEVYLTESQKKISVAELFINNKKRLIICSPFFDSRALKRKGLEELAHYSLPHFNNKENIS